MRRNCGPLPTRFTFAVGLKSCKSSATWKQAGRFGSSGYFIGAIMVLTNGTQVGRIIQVIGSTFDAEFEEGHLPEIYNALKVESEDAAKGVRIRLPGEVQQHLGGNRVRCVALGSTDGLVRGMQAMDTGK